MKHIFKQGSKFPFGAATFVELTADTTLEVIGIDNFDQLAAAMAIDGQRTFGVHLETLTHDETVVRDIDGKTMDVDVVVSYGAGGVRIETDKGEPRAHMATPRMMAAAPTAPVEPPDEIDESFPGYATLIAANITKRSELKGKSIEELEKINGIGPEIAQRINAEFVPALTDKEIAADQEQARADIARAEEEAKARDVQPSN